LRNEGEWETWYNSQRITHLGGACGFWNQKRWNVGQAKPTFGSSTTGKVLQEGEFAVRALPKRL